MSRNARFGAERERQVKKLLEAKGWMVTKAGGSLGVADLVALRAGAPPELIQVKSDKDSPYTHFGPAAREELKRVADEAGAVAQLAWWPPRKPCRWIPSGQWPS